MQCSLPSRLTGDLTAPPLFWTATCEKAGQYYHRNTMRPQPATRTSHLGTRFMPQLLSLFACSLHDFNRGSVIWKRPGAIFWVRVSCAPCWVGKGHSRGWPTRHHARNSALSVLRSRRVSQQTETRHNCEPIVLLGLQQIVLDCSRGEQSLHAPNCPRQKEGSPRQLRPAATPVENGYLSRQLFG